MRQHVRIRPTSLLLDDSRQLVWAELSENTFPLISSLVAGGKTNNTWQAFTLGKRAAVSSKDLSFALTSPPFGFAFPVPGITT